MLDKRVELDGFEQWVFDMSDCLERFMESQERGVRDRLDFSPESLVVVEEIAIQQFPDEASFRDESRASKLDELARYVGETIRRNLGGRWAIELDNEKYVCYGLPELREVGGKVRECPLSLVTAAASRKSGRYLETVFKGLARRAGRAM